jgi:hypothetical protein
MHLYNQLEETLRTSAHLIRHVENLGLYADNQEMPDVFQKMAFLPFTHLENVTIGDLNAIPQSAGTLQQLFSIPSVRRVRLEV